MISTNKSSNITQIETDFTTQLLYCAVKTGVQVNLADMGFNVFYDLIAYSSEIDAIALAKAEGKNLSFAPPMSIADMTKCGKLRG